MKILCTIIAFICFTAALAGDYEEGVAAYIRKDYATALAKFRSAAQSLGWAFSAQKSW